MAAVEQPARAGAEDRAGQHVVGVMLVGLDPGETGEARDRIGGKAGLPAIALVEAGGGGEAEAGVARGKLWSSLPSGRVSCTSCFKP